MEILGPSRKQVGFLLLSFNVLLAFFFLLFVCFGQQSFIRCVLANPFAQPAGRPPVP